MHFPIDDLYFRICSKHKTHVMGSFLTELLCGKSTSGVLKVYWTRTNRWIMYIAAGGLCEQNNHGLYAAFFTQWRIGRWIYFL